MDITFGIVTDGGFDPRINQMIDSIEALKVPYYEVIISGGRTSTIDRINTRHIPHDEDCGTEERNRQSWWITGKKNRITREAQHEFVVYMHDYHEFDPDWYIELLRYGPDFDVCCHRVLNSEGYRAYDWVTFDHPRCPPQTFIPYERTDLTQYQYVSGGYWIARRAFMLANPLDESLYSGQEEDVEWSRRIRHTASLKVNPHCVVRHNKVHGSNHWMKHCYERGFPKGI
jgi:hypothetical protein